MLEAIEKQFREAAPSVDFCSLRFVQSMEETASVRRGVADPAHCAFDRGAMVTVMHNGGLGYAATSDLSQSGLRRAIDQAVVWAKRTAPLALFDSREVAVNHTRGEYATPTEGSLADVSHADRIALLHDQCAKLKCDDRIVDWSASLWRADIETLFLTAAGGRVHQQIHLVSPDMGVAANDGTQTQGRSLGSRGETQSGGLEVLNRVSFFTRAPSLAREALELLDAPECPSGPMSLVLLPDQMMLQIHESIGHPLELDRILGDERNYAGRSFVTQEMFGNYQYGSALLNVTFDPSIAHELASYAFDDEGAPAEKTFLIRDGVLRTPLGAAMSQSRARMAGVANSRASNWNRPPIDRMANLNVEPGGDSVEDLIAGVEHGVLMATNLSWSIDDSRNKFQFGCEWGRRIENGELREVVKNPNYRGVSATFWRNLSGVGDADSMGVMGTPYCGKGEPNQAVRVGHASPACRFDGVDVFGGA
jgi:predicted Zn-dependent protease